MRLTTTKRNKLVGKKLVDLKSRRFIEHNNTYKLKEENNPTERIRQRQLEPAPQQVLSWETNEFDDSKYKRESSSDSEDEQPPPRRSTRERQPAKRLIGVKNNTCIKRRPKLMTNCSTEQSLVCS